MPINYHVNEPMHCNKLDAGLKDSIQGCKFDRKEVPKFKPTNRIAQQPVLQNRMPKPLAEQPGLPFSPLPTSITPLPNNNANPNINHLSNEKSSSNTTTDNNNRNINTKLSNENSTSNTTTDNNNRNINTKFTFFSEAERQKHLNLVDTFSKHPEFRNIDKTAALFSNAAYLEDSAAINELLNELTDLGDQGWKLSPEPKASNEWIKTFVNENGEVAVSMRGTSTWLGDDGIANVFNTSGGTEARQMINDGLNVDIRTRKARLMDDTYKFIQEHYAEKVKFTTGHSQAGYDSAYFQKNFAPQAEVINFNPAPKGVVSADIGRSWVTPNDIVSGTGKLKAQFNTGEHNVFEVRSIENTIGNRLTGGHMMGNFTEELLNEPMIEPTETTPLLKNESIKTSNHMLKSFGNAAKNFGRAGVVGAAGAGADLLVDTIAPEGTPELIKDGAKAVVGAGFMKKASSMVGAPSMAASEMIIPLFASYVATNETSKLVDNALENTNLTTTEKSTISSGSGGAAGGFAFSATGSIPKVARAARASVNAARAARAAATTAEGAEVAEAAATSAEVAEVAEVAATSVEVLEGIAAVEATEVAITEAAGVAALAQGGLDPFADAFFAASAAALGVTALGAGIGAAIGAISGASREEEEKRYEEQEKQEWARVEADATRRAEDFFERKRIREENEIIQKRNDFIATVGDVSKFGRKYDKEAVLRDALAVYDANVNDPNWDPIDYWYNAKEGMLTNARKEYENPGYANSLYEVIENDPDYKKSLEANDRVGVNQAIRNIIWANNEDYGDIIDNKTKLPQIGKNGQFMQTTFDDHEHIWADSPAEFTKEDNIAGENKPPQVQSA